MKLNLGSGTKKIAGWINCDFDKNTNPDKIVNLNALPLPFADNSVHEIMLDNVVEHLHIPLDTFIGEMRRILKRNGTMTLILPNVFRWKSRIHFLLGRLEDSDGWEFNHTLLIRPSEMRSLLRNKGFAVEPKAGLIEDLTWPEIKFYVRKREDC